MTIHREGYASLALAALVLGGSIFGISYAWPEQTQLLQIWGAFSLLLFLVILQFFRHPSRRTVAGPLDVIAPADGKIVVIEETQLDEFLTGRAIQISIFMSPFNVHVNRSPIDGEVEYFKYHPGKYLVAWHPKSSTENERTTMVVKSANGSQVLVRQIAGALARRIVWYVKPGMRLQAGQEFGFIKFGSRVDVFLPVGTEIKAKLGDTTRGGETVIASLN